MFKRLETAKILYETTGREWGTLYLAKPILKVIEVEEHVRV